jgi:DNA-binding NtrC family response regulator/CHASE2 domain-containing sensor protein
MNINLLSNKKILRIILPMIAVLVFITVPKIPLYINSAITNGFYSIKGESQPDSNIVIIEITDEDITNLGGWPLKRSYYALLIDNLSRLNVKKIGLEVFLSEKIRTQEIYNNVLVSSVRKSKNVILSSIVENLIKDEDEWNADNVILPFGKNVDNRFKTGHINFASNNGIIIPAKIMKDKYSEYSFASLLADKDFSEDIKVNFLTSWDSYQKYSLLQFFSMIDEENTLLKTLAGKTIIIGVSDPLIAKTVPSSFDKEIPGIGLHALALDNILNENSINFKYFSISEYLFLIFGFILSIVFFDKLKLLVSFVFVFIVLAYFIWSLTFVQLNYFAMLFPLLISALGGFAYIFLQREKDLTTSITESEELKDILFGKEEKLQRLKEELKNNKQSKVLNEKLNELQNEIENLKQSEKDDNALFDQTSEPKIFEGIVYRSKMMDNIVNLIKKVAPENASVLIEGESGSGKELVANAIHKLSKRKSQKIVVVNCAALPESLLESELFGHIKGAFTDASRDKIGRFEEADKGTLFLDEIGETSENFQVKLLRVLQTGDFQKVGSSQTQHVDVRVIAATNKNLQQLVSEGKFREDLFYRLNVIRIEIPTLNERSDDIEILVKYFVENEKSEMNISKAVMKKLVNNTWKGNIRELESTIKRAVIFASSDNRDILKLRDLPAELSIIDKSNLEYLILESLREKEFSHSSINETAGELGDLNRTVISENFRGILFKNYVETNFDFDTCVQMISQSDSDEINKKVGSKLKQYLKNIENDLVDHQNKNLEEIKVIFKSKYKNLPQKFHFYLDQIILHLI